MAIMRGLAALLALALVVTLAPARAAKSLPHRLALVLANAAYPAAPLATSANDAGLIAATLRDAGFDVAAAQDLDLPAAQQSVQEFINRLGAAGSDTVAFVYLSGYGAQILGENYLLLAGAQVLAPEDVPGQGLLLSQFLRAVASVPARQRIIVLDLARANPMAPLSTLTPGLALPEVPPGMLLAMNTAPGTIAEREPAPYGTYALALGASLREPGLALEEAFVRTRLRASMQTAGSQTPWHVSTLRDGLPLFGGPADVHAVPDGIASIRARAVGVLAEPEAYVAALDRDTLKGYVEFLAAYPRGALARRMAALLAARREALHWRHVVADDRPQAYWTYLQRYDRGAHAGEARLRLASLKAQVRPPSVFAVLDDGLAPLLEAEQTYVARGIVLDAPDLFVPPPPPPAWLPLPPLWSPARPAQPGNPFELPVPEIARVEATGPQRPSGTIGLPSAVAAALAAQRLVLPRPAPMETAPVAVPQARPSPVVILPPEIPPSLQQKTEPMRVPVDTPVAPPPVAPTPRPPPVVIMPVEPTPEPPLAAPQLEAPPLVEPLRPTSVPIMPPEDPAPVPAVMPPPVAITPVEAPHPAPVPITPVESPRPAPVVITPVEPPTPAAPLAEPPGPAPQLPAAVPPPAEAQQPPRPAPVAITPVDPAPLAIPVLPPAKSGAAATVPLVPLPPAPEDTGLPLPANSPPLWQPQTPAPVLIAPVTPPVAPPATIAKKPPPARPAPKPQVARPAPPHRTVPRAQPARPAPVRAAPPRQAAPAQTGTAPLDLRPPPAGKLRKNACGAVGQPVCP